METPKPGIYYHFKDSAKHYEVIGIAYHTETEEPMVVYKRLYHSDIPLMHVRPLQMFMENVDRPELGYTGPRFVWVGERSSTA